jgi:hypothetical protein
MIHHISLAVHNPLHAAEVLAEIWHGKAVPFSPHPGSYIVVTLDACGTAIEFLPKNTVLTPGLDDQPIQFSNLITDFNTDFKANAIGYTATHANIAVPSSEAEIYSIAQREGWRSLRCKREDFFELIELWIENEVLIELLPPNLIDGYLKMMQPENLKAILDEMIASHDSLNVA